MSKLTPSQQNAFTVQKLIFSNRRNAVGETTYKKFGFKNKAEFEAELMVATERFKDILWEDYELKNYYDLALDDEEIAV